MHRGKARNKGELKNEGYSDDIAENKRSQNNTFWHATMFMKTNDMLWHSRDMHETKRDISSQGLQVKRFGGPRHSREEMK